MTLPTIEEAKYEIGYGLTVSLPRHWALPIYDAALSEGPWWQTQRMIRVGSARFMSAEGIAMPSHIQRAVEAGEARGHSFVYVAINQQLAGAIELRATICPEARQLVQDLRQRHMEMYIISGDHEEPTRNLVRELGIDHYFAETLPEHKADLISQLQAEGKSVCFVGDGINDAIALKRANMSISLRGASSAATDAAQIVLMNQDLNQLLQVFEVARQFRTNMKLNLTANMVPGVIIVFGALFWGFGVAHSVILNDIGVVIGASNAVWPWLREQREQQSQRRIRSG